jgi:hypothetical protein
MTKYIIAAVAAFYALNQYLASNEIVTAASFVG